jgi:peptide/nickel transport system permease protein
MLPVLSLTLLAVGYTGRVIRAATAAAVRAPHVEFLRLNGIAPGVVLRTAVRGHIPIRSVVVVVTLVRGVAVSIVDVVDVVAVRDATCPHSGPCP